MPVSTRCATLIRMSRTFKTADYDPTLDLTIRLGDCVPPDHVARFVVDTIAHLDLSAIYARDGARGGQPYAPDRLLAQLAGVLKLGNISLDGTKIHADAVGSKAVSYQHLVALEAHLHTEVEELFAVSDQATPGDLPDGLVVSDAIASRQARLARLA